MAADNKRDQELQLADQLLDTALLGRELSHAAMQQALAEAKAGKLRDPAKTAQNAIIASGVALDKRLVIQERPNGFTVNIDLIADGQALIKQLGIQTTATEIPTPELPAGPNPAHYGATSQAGASEPKTRTRVSKRPAKKPAPKPSD